MSERILITGINGQLGSYIAEKHLARGDEVYGIIRRSSSIKTDRIDHILDRLKLSYNDITDSAAMDRIIRTIMPDKIFSLAAQTHVRVSFDVPKYTLDTIIYGTLNILESVRNSKLKTKIYNSSSSEIFGTTTPPQSLESRMMPCSPYGIAKLAAHHLCENYRNSYGINVWNGICFNMESPRRTPTFVTRKITSAAARIKMGLQKELILGNMKAMRDWQFCGDAADGAIAALDTDDPTDYIFCTGKSFSVQEFAESVFGQLNMDHTKYIKTDLRYFRPTEVDALQGDYSKAKRILGWEPRTSFKQLVELMVNHDLKLAQIEKFGHSSVTQANL